MQQIQQMQDAQQVEQMQRAQQMRWYTSMNDAGNPESGESYGADNLLKSRQGVYAMFQKIMAHTPPIQTI